MAKSINQTLIEQYINSVKEVSGQEILTFLFAHNMCVGEKDVSKVWDSVLDTIKYAQEFTRILEAKDALGKLILSRIFILELKKRGLYLISGDEGEREYDKILPLVNELCGEPWNEDPYAIIDRMKIKG